MQERLTRQERKAQTRARLLDAASKVFAERGLEAASIDEVAAAAGYTKGAVYSNFASKTDLVIALLERRIASQSAQYTRRFEGQAAEAMARDLLRTPAQVPATDREFLILAVEFWLHAMRDERARRLVAEQYETARGIVADFLIASGYGESLSADGLSARDLAIVIEALGTGVALQAALDPDNVSLALWAKALATLLGLPQPESAGPAAPEATAGAGA
jgi:AcrR family transcriptional regulator